jgi:hypothetical protein
MGWRDRVKKSFADIADTAEGIQNLKNPEKKEKEGFKTTFKHLTQNTQNTQNGPDEGGKSKDPKPDQDPDKNRAVKMSVGQNKPDPAATPAPEPASLGAEYADLWNRAWKLADFIDNPQAAPLAERKARLPALDRLRERMADIERQTTPTATPEPKPAPPGTWHTWESIGTTRDRSPENCTAMCKRSGKCYAGAYYQGKPGKAKDCEPDGCIHKSNERGTHEKPKLDPQEI